ncbi:MAG: HD domain-containing protein [archaeon]
MKWLAVLEKEIKAEMEKAPSVVSSHDINHIKRVWKYAQHIAQGKDIDYDVLAAAAFLHDIGRHYPQGAREHGPVSEPLARKVLERINFPEDKRKNVLLSIKYHDETFPPEKRTTTESRVLYDADKLDVFGAVGISRFLVLNAMRGKSLNETADYALQNLPLRFERLEFPETRTIAWERYEYALDYFRKLKKEISIRE